MLYHLGPNCSTSNRDALLAIREKYHLGVPDDKNVHSDLTINTSPISDGEIEKLLEVMGEVYVNFKCMCVIVLKSSRWFCCQCLHTDVS